MDKIVVVILKSAKKELRFLTTGDQNDRMRIATRLVILKSEGVIKDWNVFPVETMARKDLDEMIGLHR